jgi:hypothetical protein
MLNPCREAGNSATMEFPKPLTIIGNFAVLLWIVLGSIGFWLYNQAAGWLFLIVSLIAVYGVLKFIGCMRPCYHCKRCTRGFGRISALFFGKRSLKDPKESYGMASAVFFYALLGPFPAVLSFVSTIQMFTVFKLLVSLCLLTITVFSGLTWRKTIEP